MASNSEPIQTANILNSGGATGADSVFAQEAYKANHKCKIHSFVGHDTSPKDSCFPDKLRYNVIRYNKTQLKDILLHPLAACKLLGKTVNTKTGNTFYYLTRDYYIISKVNSVYAIGYLNQEKNTNTGVDGGTGITCQMFALKYNHMRNLSGAIPMYLYCQTKKNWFQCQYNALDKTYEWSSIEAPPRPIGNYAGIGSRKLTVDGEREIKNLYK